MTILGQYFNINYNIFQWFNSVSMPKLEIIDKNEDWIY